jgi:hypothetical protein
MTVIAFPPRVARPDTPDAVNHHAVTGTFRSPRARRGEMTGILRVATLRPTPDGVRLTGVFTAELREDDGAVIGLDSRRATVAAEVVDGSRGPLFRVGPLDLDLMGITVHVAPFTIDPPPGRAAIGGADDAPWGVRGQGGGDSC